MQHGVVLDICVSAYADGMNIAANHGIHPDTGVFAKYHIANHLRGNIHVASAGNGGQDALVGPNHLKSSTWGAGWRCCWPEPYSSGASRAQLPQNIDHTRTKGAMKPAKPPRASAGHDENS
jgi:hypothetical protein